MSDFDLAQQRWNTKIQLAPVCAGEELAFAGLATTRLEASSREASSKPDTLSLCWDLSSKGWLEVQ